MQYVIIPIAKAESIGILPVAHQTSDTEILLSEMELMRNASLTGTITERAAHLGASLYNAQQAERYVIDHEFHIYE